MLISMQTDTVPHDVVMKSIDLYGKIRYPGVQVSVGQVAPGRQNPPEDRWLEYRNLGRTGVKVSPLILGCAGFGNRADEAESIEIIDRAIDAGINFIDTANSYSRGVSETIVGKALKSNGQRDRIVLATKVHFPMDGRRPERVRHQPAPHHRAVQSIASAPTDRLDRSIPDSQAALRPCHRRDATGVG